MFINIIVAESIGGSCHAKSQDISRQSH